MPHVARRSTHSLLPLDLLTPPVACLQGHSCRGARGGRDGGPAATSHSAPVPGRGSYSSPLLCEAFWPLRVEGRGTRLMPPAPPVLPLALCGRLDTQSHTQTSTLLPDDPPQPYTLTHKLSWEVPFKSGVYLSWIFFICTH